VSRNCLKLSEPHAGSLSSSGSEFQTVGLHGDQKRPTAICVETTARYNDLVTVCRMQTIYFLLMAMDVQFSECHQQQLVDVTANSKLPMISVHDRHLRKC